jgi:hypothetical protein
MTAKLISFGPTKNPDIFVGNRNTLVFLEKILRRHKYDYILSPRPYRIRVLSDPDHTNKAIHCLDLELSLAHVTLDILSPTLSVCYINHDRQYNGQFFFSLTTITYGKPTCFWIIVRFLFSKLSFTYNAIREYITTGTSIRVPCTMIESWNRTVDLEILLLHFGTVSCTYCNRHTRNHWAPTAAETKQKRSLHRVACCYWWYGFT